MTIFSRELGLERTCAHERRVALGLGARGGVRGGGSRGDATVGVQVGGVAPRRPLRHESAVHVTDAAARGPIRAFVRDVVVFVVAPAGRSDSRRRCGLSAAGGPVTARDDQLGRCAEYRARSLKAPAETAQKKCSLVLSRRRNLKFPSAGRHKP